MIKPTPLRVVFLTLISVFGNEEGVDLGNSCGLCIILFLGRGMAYSKSFFNIQNRTWIVESSCAMFFPYGSPTILFSVVFSDQDFPLPPPPPLPPDKKKQRSVLYITLTYPKMWSHWSVSYLLSKDLPDPAASADRSDSGSCSSTPGKLHSATRRDTRSSVTHSQRSTTTAVDR